MAFNRIEIILQHLQDKHYAEWCCHYGEPGYTDPEKGIIFCNWNKVSKRIADELEAHGYELEWSDEWTIDYHYSKAYRTSPDSYGWQSQIHYLDDGEMLTPDDSASAWIDEFSNDRPRPKYSALPSRITGDDLMEAGYTLFEEELEAGLHPGQTDDPAIVAKRAFADPKVERVVFRITDVGQFDVRFECWVLLEEETQSA